MLGRIDNVINTGGVKVHIEQVEQALAPQMLRPFLITGCPDARFGEIVVMLLQGGEDDLAAARDAVCRCLDKYSRPKQILLLPELPLTPNGKPARSRAAAIARELLSRRD